MHLTEGEHNLARRGDNMANVGMLVEGQHG